MHILPQRDIYLDTDTEIDIESSGMVFTAIVEPPLCWGESTTFQLAPHQPPILFSSFKPDVSPTQFNQAAHGLNAIYRKCQPSACA